MEFPRKLFVGKIQSSQHSKKISKFVMVKWYIAINSMSFFSDHVSYGRYTVTLHPQLAVQITFFCEALLRR